MNRAKEFMCGELKTKYRVKAALQYIIYEKFAEKKCLSLIKESPDKKMILLFLVPGLILYFKWKRVFKTD